MRYLMTVSVGGVKAADPVTPTTILDRSVRSLLDEIDAVSVTVRLSVHDEIPIDVTLTKEARP